MPADLYDVLGASDDAAAEEIKRAYRDRVREYHPDVNDHPDSDAQFKLVRTAHDVLSNPAERNTYDRLGHREYVEQNLDELPPISVFPDEDLPDDVSAGDTGSSGTGTSSATGRTTSSTSTTSSTNTSSSATGASTTGRSSGSRSETRTGSDTDTARSSSGRSGYGNTGSESSSGEASTAGGASSGATKTGSQSNDWRSTSTGSDESSWEAATNSTQTATSSSVPAGVRRRRGLKRWYGVVALSLVLYLGGLGVYAMPRQAALRGAVADATAAPVPTLLGPFPLSSPTAYLLTAARAVQAGTPTLGLVLLAGTALLPLVVLTTVGRFGRGAAWMYAIPSLGPAVTLAVWPVVAVPTAAALVGLLVLPVLSAGGFLVDVGRYLRATR